MAASALEHVKHQCWLGTVPADPPLYGLSSCSVECDGNATIEQARRPQNRTVTVPTSLPELVGTDLGSWGRRKVEWLLTVADAVHWPSGAF